MSSTYLRPVALGQWKQAGCVGGGVPLRFHSHHGIASQRGAGNTFFKTIWEKG